MEFIQVPEPPRPQAPLITPEFIGGLRARPGEWAVVTRTSSANSANQRARAMRTRDVVTDWDGRVQVKGMTDPTEREDPNPSATPGGVVVARFLTDDQWDRITESGEYQK